MCIRLGALTPFQYLSSGSFSLEYYNHFMITIHYI